MPFNVNKFVSTHFEPRLGEVPVPELRDWFDDLAEDETPVFQVRSLTRVDFIRMQEASDRDEGWAELITAAGAGNVSALIDATKEQLGLSEDMPETAAREIVMLECGMHEPAFTREASVKLYHAHPMIVLRLITKISEVTNAGWTPGKPSPSTPTALSVTG
jgi:hypothetical protein